MSDIAEEIFDDLVPEFLVDEEHGHGATVSDMRELFRQMASGMDFFAAFETILGMSVADYADDFYELMEVYLSY